MHSQANPDRRNFVFYWATATVLGWITAHIAGGIVFIVAWAAARAVLEGIFPPVNQLDSTTVAIGNAALIILSVIPATIVMCFYVAALQWKTPLSRVSSSKWQWIGASVVSGSILGLLLAASFRTFVDAEGYLIFPELEIIEFVGVLGFLGIIIGFPQWLVLRRYAPQASIWILANMIGIIAAIVLVTLVNWWLIGAANDTASFLAATASYCLGIPAVFGIITGFVLFHLLQHGKRTPE